MSDHTPSTLTLRIAYVDDNRDSLGVSEAQDEFDRAIAKVRAEAKQEALREAVNALNEIVDSVAARGITNGLEWQTGALAMRDQLKIRADKLVTE